MRPNGMLASHEDHAPNSVLLPAFAVCRDRGPVPQDLRGTVGAPDETLLWIMQGAPIRPRFELFVDLGAEDALRLVEARIEASETIRGWVSLPYAELRVPERDRFAWSPRMALYAEDAPGGANLLCRFQPEPDVWTAYLALWAVVGLSTLGVVMYGFSQWVLRGVPWVMLAGLPVLGVAALLLYLVALTGQRRGATQMWLLERELQAALDGHGPRLVAEVIDDLPRTQGFG